MKYTARYTVLLLPLVLIGCATTAPTYLRSGASAVEVERQVLQCSAQAQRDFPVARQSSRITIGGRFCEGPFCLGAARGVPTQSSLDANQAIRQRAIDLCMQDAGFTPAQVPVCTPGTPRALLTRQPATTEALCVANGQLHRQTG